MMHSDENCDVHIFGNTDLWGLVAYRCPSRRKSVDGCWNFFSPQLFYNLQLFHSHAWSSNYLDSKYESSDGLNDVPIIIIIIIFVFCLPFP